MFGFASIAGGAPSSVGGMTDHLLNNTLSPEQSRLAAYYTRGLARQPDQELSVCAELVANGHLPHDEAMDRLMEGWLRRGGDPDRLEAAGDRIAARLDDAIRRVEKGEPAIAPPLAVLRPDMHPLVAQGLGIDPEVPLTRDQINGLLAGRSADGEKIEGKTYAKVRHLGVNPKTGEETVSQPIGSYDFTPSPDKSVSVAWAFAPPTEQAAIFHAHVEAARTAMAYMAKEIGVVRTGAGGEGEELPGHVTWLEFTHHTARPVKVLSGNGGTRMVRIENAPGDPDLHTHMLVPNVVYAEGGTKVGSLNTKRIAGFMFEADALYHATLAQNLRDAGFDVVMDEKTGAARMVAVPDEMRALFSKRTNAGEAAARAFTAERGENWDELSPEQQTARTRTAAQAADQKGGKDGVADIADWKRQARDAAGWEPRSFLAYGPPAPELAPGQRIRMAYDAALPFVAGKLEQKAVISHWDLRTAAGRGLVHAGIKDADDLGAVTALMRQEGVDQYGERTALVWGEEDKRIAVTTTLHAREELEFVALAKEAAGDRSGALPAGVLRRHIRDSGLDFSDDHGRAQRAMIERLGTGGGLGVAIAAAGAGKTTALQPLVAAWKEQGRQVFGASLAWRQADDMVEAGIDRQNVKAFSVLIDAAKGGDIKLDRNSVVTVDEWGLLGTRQGLELLRLREQHGFSIVALGDDKQCSSIQAGAIIELSRRALGPEQVPVIVTTVRQQTEREREIVGLFRAGRAKEALDMKRQDGTAEMVPGGYNEAVARVARLYAERTRETGAAPTVSAPTNADAHRISLAIRDERRAMGQVGPDEKRIQVVDPDGRVADMALAKGDRVRLFKSTGARFADGGGGSIGRNGSVLEVVALDDRGMTARSAKTGREGWVAWESLADTDRARPPGLWRGDDHPHRARQHGAGAHRRPAVRQPGGERAASLLGRHTPPAAIVPGDERGGRAAGRAPASSAERHARDHLGRQVGQRRAELQRPAGKGSRTRHAGPRPQAPARLGHPVPARPVGCRATRRQRLSAVGAAHDRDAPEAGRDRAGDQARQGAGHARHPRPAPETDAGSPASAGARPWSNDFAIVSDPRRDSKAPLLEVVASMFLGLPAPTRHPAYR